MFDLAFKKSSKMKITFSRAALLLLIVALGVAWISALRTHALSQIVLTGYILSLLTFIYLTNTIQTVVDRAFALKRSYAYFRYEILTSILLGISLIVASTYVLFMVLPTQGQIEASKSIIIMNAVCILLLATAMYFAVKKQLPNSTLVYKITFSTFAVFPSVIALTSSIYAQFSASPFVERLSTLLIILFILRNCWLILKNASQYLMEGIPHKLDLIQLTSDLQSFDSVEKVQGISAWSIATNLFGIKCKIVVTNIERSQFIVDEITDFIINHYNVEHISFEIINSTSEGKI